MTNWDDIYKKELIPNEHSTFSELCLKYMKSGESLLDVACGNGRDSYLFAKNKIWVLGIDGSKVIIDKNNNNYKDENLRFVNMNINEKSFLALKTLDMNHIYCRFFLHAINKNDYLKFLNNSYDILSKNGKIYIECRSVRDPLYGKGEKGDNEDEFIYGHYRRFIKMNEILIDLILMKFKIIYAEENNNWSIMDSDNPFLIRIIAEK